jgi:catalase
MVEQEPSYYPNGFNGPIPRERPWHQDRVEGWTNRDELVSTDDYSQARKLVMEVFDDAARERFIANVAGNLVYAPPVVRERTLRNMFDPVDKGVGDRIREQMKKLSSMSSLPPPA